MRGAGLRGVALLRDAFCTAPFTAHLRCLLRLLYTVDDNLSIADLSRLLKPPALGHRCAPSLGARRPRADGMSPFVDLMSQVISVLARLCSAIFCADIAVAEADAHAATVEEKAQAVELAAAHTCGTDARAGGCKDHRAGHYAR